MYLILYRKYLNVNENELILERDSDRLLPQIKYEENLINSVDRYSYDLPPTEELEGSRVNSSNIEGITALTIVYLFIFTAIFILKFGLQKVIEKKPNEIRPYSKIACRKCYFFNKNRYLRCAVHPDKVLTDRAENCQDYQAKK
ncbi:MAG: hypothetical protein AAGK10_03445 [Cyanobacteria bacterium J06555_3]